jgi:uncharacterized membrane protein YhaH (DUF805 family)
MIKAVVTAEQMERAAIIKNATRKRRINMRRLRDYLLDLAVVILGIVILICNMTKTIPPLYENAIFDLVAFFIAYGILTGPLVMFMGVCMIIETRERKYPKQRQKPRRRARR